MRGQRCFLSGCTACLRIIPARAGPTHLSLSVMVSAADHPRSCGANTLTLLRAIYPSGSSPLVRGQHQHDLLPTPFLRIIPARAGPTSMSPYPLIWFADHPRSCGANQTESGRQIWSNGSSPLVRGQRHRPGADRQRHRIIPARAGPTTGQPLPDIALADHPRSCGANFGDAFGVVAESGSSPLVRGQLDAHTYLSVCIRIIPARAGPT